MCLEPGKKPVGSLDSRFKVKQRVPFRTDSVHADYTLHHASSSFLPMKVIYLDILHVRVLRLWRKRFGISRLISSSPIDAPLHCSGAWTSAPTSRQSTSAFSGEESESRHAGCRVFSKAVLTRPELLEIFYARDSKAASIGVSQPFRVAQRALLYYRLNEFQKNSSVFLFFNAFMCSAALPAARASPDKSLVAYRSTREKKSRSHCHHDEDGSLVVLFYECDSTHTVALLCRQTSKKVQVSRKHTSSLLKLDNFLPSLFPEPLIGDADQSPPGVLSVSPHVQGN